MANILLGVTGSVAAIKTPELFDSLSSDQNRVKIVATKAACYFFDPTALSPTEAGRRNPDVVILDEDEWPGDRYLRDDPVLHIELRRWADVFVVAPLDANTLGKFALGITDNCLTCVWRAWEPERPLVLAPAMNTRMWIHAATARHLRQIEEDLGGNPLDSGLSLDDVVPAINDSESALRIVPPQTKRLACDDVGVGALAEVSDVAAAVREVLARGDSIH